MAELVFNALSGPELKAAILADIGKKLDDTGEFPANISFPWVKYEFSVGVVAYPKQDVDGEPLIKAKGEFETLSPIPTNEQIPEPPRVVAVAGEKTIDTPDKTRIETGQPIPTVQPGPGGVLVDKMVEVAPQPAPAQRKGTFQKAAQATVKTVGLNPPEAPNGTGNA